MRAMWYSYAEVGMDFDLDPLTLIGLTDDRMLTYTVTDYYTEEELMTMAIEFLDGTEYQDGLEV